MTQRSLVSDELHFTRPLFPDHPENQRCDEGDLFNDKHAAAVTVSPWTSTGPFQNAPPTIQSYPADAFAAITFCFPGFDDNMEELFENSTQDAR